MSTCSPTKHGDPQDGLGRVEHRLGPSRALVGEDEADEVGAGVDGDVDVVLSCQPADLDERPRRRARRAAHRDRGAHQRRADKTAFAPASSASAACARDSIALSAIRIRSRGASARSRSWARRSMRNVPRSRALIPITGASSATARCELVRVVRLDERVEAERLCLAKQRGGGGVVEVAQDQQRGVGAAVAHSRRGRPGAEKKPFASSGSDVAARAARRSSSEPPKRCVDEHRHRAGAGSVVALGHRGDVAVRPQVARRRRAALELGDRAEAGWRRARPRTSYPPAWRTRRAARAARLRRPSREPRGRPRARRADRPRGRRRRSLLRRSAGSRTGGRRSRPRTRRECRGILLGGAAAQLGRIAARHSEVERVDLAPSARLPSTTSQTRFGPTGDSSSIPPAPCTTNARRAPSRASTSAITGTSAGRVDADDLRACTGRIRQRSEHVEHGARCELGPNRAGVLHRRVVRRREHEPEAELVDRLGDPFGPEFEVEAEAARGRRRCRRATTPLGCHAWRHRRRRRPRRAPPRSRC